MEELEDILFMRPYGDESVCSEDEYDEVLEERVRFRSLETLRFRVDVGDSIASDRTSMLDINKHVKFYVQYW